jgi:hypothetical protein
MPSEMVLPPRRHGIKFNLMVSAWLRTHIRIVSDSPSRHSSKSEVRLQLHPPGAGAVFGK